MYVNWNRMLRLRDPDVYVFYAEIIRDSSISKRPVCVCYIYLKVANVTELYITWFVYAHVLGVTASYR